MKSYLILVGFLISASFAYCAPAPQAGTSTTKSAAKSAVAKGNPQSLDLNEKGTQAVKARDFKGAEELFRRSLAVDPGNVTAAFNLAGMYITNHKEDLAITLLKEYLTKAPNDAGLYARIGDAYFSSKNINDAAAHYEQAIKLQPGYPGVTGKLGTIYTLQNRLTDSENMLLQAVKESPKDGQLLANLSSVFLANGKADRAVSTAKRALQVIPTSEVYITLGNAYEALKDFKNSVIAYQRAVDLGDTRPELKTKIEQISKIAGNA